MNPTTVWMLFRNGKPVLTRNRWALPPAARPLAFATKEAAERVARLHDYEAKEVPFAAWREG